MRFATIAHVNEDSTVDLRYADGYETNSAATLNGYQPVQFEQVVVIEVEDVAVVLGSVYNAPNELESHE